MAKGRKTGGRQRGSLNRATAEIKEAARAHGLDAIKSSVKYPNILLCRIV
jgi:hypothetical protein